MGCFLTFMVIQVANYRLAIGITSCFLMYLMFGSSNLQAARLDPGEFCDSCLPFLHATGGRSPRCDYIHGQEFCFTFL